MVSPQYNPAQIHRVAMLDMPDYPGVAGSGQIVASILEKYLLWTNYSVIERSQVDQVLNEQSFAVSGAVDQSTAHNVGKLLGVDALILGNITDYSNSQEQTVMVDMPQEQSDPIFGKVVSVQHTPNGEIRSEQNIVTGYAQTQTNEVVPQTETLPAHAALTVRLVSVETGEVLWSASAGSDGVSPSAAAEQASAALMQSLVKKLQKAGTLAAAGH